MPMRSSSLANNPLVITRELDGRYDVVLQVRDNLDLIEQVAGVDFAAILAELESAQDFTGITVVQGETVAWDAVNKILTVPKGDKGDKGDTGNTGLTGPQGIQGPQGIKGDTGLKGDTGSQGPKGFDGAAGAQGLKGDTGDDLTITQITYNGNGTFNWLFSDGTTYVTPDLRGPKGDTGNQGVKGDQGISVHHIKGTSTTDLEGDFGAYSEIDTYTVYGDANETINLGFFRVNNGAAKEGQYGLMYKSTYDITANGIVDNSEKLEGRTIAQIQADITDTIGASNGIASLDATTKLDRTQVPTMNVTLEGDVSGSFAVDGSLNTTVNVVVQDNSHSHTFSNLTATPITLSGYGITDADTSAQVSTKISTAVAALVDSSPATLDTLNELAAALGDDPNFATTTATAIGTKVTKNADITAGTATKVTYDAKGLVTNGTTLSAGDIPVLDAGKITTGTLPVLRGGTGTTTSTGTGSVVLSSSPVLVTPTIGVATGTSFNSITGLSNTAALAAGIAAIGTSTLVARQDHVHPVQTTISGNAGTATTLATARTIGMTGDVTWTSASFNGSGDVTGTATLATITDSGTGSFKKITTNSKGLVTGTVSVTQADITGLLGAGSISNTMLANGAVATLSGTNTGDETLATIKTKLGITTLSGSNTGDQTITLTGDVTGTGTGSFVTTLKNTGTTGTYRSVTTDAQGRVTAGTNPTTISGYGITDAVTKVPSTDNAIVRFDGTTGDVQNSGVIIDDAGNLVISGVGSLKGSFGAGGISTNLALGAGALQNNTTGNNNTASGVGALQSNTTGNNNTASGVEALQNNTTGYNNTANGVLALQNNTTGVNNTASGVYALQNNTTGSWNTASGVNALLSNTTFSNVSGFGNNSQVTGSNQVQLGDASTTTYVYGTVQNRSDIRDKADVRDTLLGLDFIKALRPVDYRWDMRDDYKPERPDIKMPETSDENYEELKAEYDRIITEWLEACKHENIVRDGSKKRTRFHQGFIAQEVLALNSDFGGIQDHSVKGGEDVLSIGYDEIIAPLVKAVQEQQAMIEELKARIEIL